MADSSPITVDRLLQALEQGEMELVGLMPDSSNYTFLAQVKQESIETLAIYKPRRGESPLWDFPRGTLCQRELASFLVSAALGWQIVPPTVLREVDPHGFGSVQFFIDADPEVHYFALRGKHDDAFKRIAAFDVITNNADRKGGHILLGSDGHIWGIDHGITFHTDPKLRTVIWEYAGEPLADELIADLASLQTRLESANDLLLASLKQLLANAEIAAFQRRVERLIARPVYPTPGGGRSMPWPPI